jgi:hypothetical protein
MTGLTGRRIQSCLAFRLMSLEFRLRDLIRPPLKILREAGMKPGMSVLDLKKETLLEAVTSGGLFQRAGRTRWSYRFELRKGNTVSK